MPVNKGNIASAIMARLDAIQVNVSDRIIPGPEALAAITGSNYIPQRQTLRRSFHHAVGYQGGPSVPIAAHATQVGIKRIVQLVPVAGLAGSARPARCHSTSGRER